jgi:O-antigen ligase
LYLFFIIYILSVRISILALATIFIIFVIKHSTHKWFIIFGLLLLTVAVYQSPNFQKRFNPIDEKGKKIEEVYIRLEQWKSVINVTYKTNLIIGNGTGSHKNILYEEYRKNNLETPYKEKYNAHNQYLEIFYSYGILGFLVFLFSFLTIALSILKSKNTVNTSIILTFLIYMMTESLLERHSGIVLFSLIIPLLLKFNNSKK